MTDSSLMFSRRSLLKVAATGAGVALAAPAFVRNAGASSGELSLLVWSDELPDPVIKAFTDKTGIRVTTTPFSLNEEQANKLQASYGEGYDLCMPTANRAAEYKFLEVLAPLDPNKLHLDAYVPAMLAPSKDSWTWDGGLYHLPHVWGSEGLSWRSDLADIHYQSASYGLVWDKKYAGKVLIRPLSGLLTLGLWLDATGKLPSNKMHDTYKDESTARKVYDEILTYAVDRKSQIKTFWDSADSIRTGYLNNGCVLGVTWDGPAQKMRREGKPVRYIAPQEGALGWIDGWSLVKAAKNIDQAYALLNFLSDPEVSALVTKETGYNPVVNGAEKHLTEIDRQIFADTYPDDAVQRLWFYPPAPGWYNATVNEYVEKFKAA